MVPNDTNLQYTTVPLVFRLGNPVAPLVTSDQEAVKRMVGLTQGLRRTPVPTDG
jgi:hypothetical protein